MAKQTGYTSGRPKKEYFYLLDMSHLDFAHKDDPTRNRCPMPYWGPIHREDLKTKMRLLTPVNEEPPNEMRHDYIFHMPDPIRPLAQQNDICMRTDKPLAPSRTQQVEKPPRFRNGRTSRREVVRMTSNGIWVEITDKNMIEQLRPRAVTRRWLDEIFVDEFSEDKRAEAIWRRDNADSEVSA